MADPPQSSKSQVVIAGGGIAGLEALLALRDLAGDRVEITLVAPTPEFLYKPLTVEEPFSAEPAERRELEPIAREFGARFVQRAVSSVEPGARSVALDDGSQLAYDFLLVCVGARARPAFSNAITFEVAGESLRIESLLDEVAATEGKAIAFVVPPGMSWPLPVYELALMTRRLAGDRGAAELECIVVTPEAAPLIMFGPMASEAVAETLRARRIEVIVDALAAEDEDGRIVLHPGHRVLEAERVVALPKLEGPAIPGLPADEHGFIPIDEHARVQGLDAVYAAGDGTTFPIKHGGLGTEQADAAAEHVSAAVGAPVEPQPFRPVLRGKLIVGEEALNLRADVAGGAGEGIASADYLWWPPHKVSGRYLAPWLAGTTPRTEPEPPPHSVDVEVALPHEWHREPMALDPYGPPDLDRR
jgi:sulfide:quinone oxidoreductase